MNANNNEPETFNVKCIEEILKANFKDKSKTRINNDGVKAVTEILRIFVAEAAARSALQAKEEGETEVGVEHLEKIIPQLLFDF